MNLSPHCIGCLIRRQVEFISRHNDSGKASAYLREVCRIIADAAPEEPAPVLISRINKIHTAFYGSNWNYGELKKSYNTLLLQREDEIYAIIRQSDDPLCTALKYARAGNYIDFGALGTVDNGKLDELLARVPGETADPETYRRLCSDLEHAQRLTYLTDNCGEIVLDKLFIREIKKRFPAINVTVIVRGEPVLNDATMEDAAETGITEVATVLGNGTSVPGTWIPFVSASAKNALESADVIISKGQGNFETLNGCGLNVYYLFLCKCKLFVELFNLEQYKGVLINERLSAKNARRTTDFLQSV